VIPTGDSALLLADQTAAIFCGGGSRCAGRNGEMHKGARILGGGSKYSSGRLVPRCPSSLGGDRVSEGRAGVPRSRRVHLDERAIRSAWQLVGMNRFAPVSGSGNWQAR